MRLRSRGRGRFPEATHRYVGPSTRWGLRKGSAVKVLRRSHGSAGVAQRQVATADGREWRVDLAHLSPLAR